MGMPSYSDQTYAQTLAMYGGDPNAIPQYVLEHIDPATFPAGATPPTPAPAAAQPAVPDYISQQIVAGFGPNWQDSYTYDPVAQTLIAKDGSGSYSFGGQADPSLGTNVVMPDGSTQNFAQGTNPVFPDVGNSAPIGLSPEEAYKWYADQKSGNLTNFELAALGLIGGPVLATTLGGAGGAAAGGVGDAGAAGGSGAGSALGGGGTALYPYEATGGSIFGSGTAGGIGDSIIATGGVPAGAVAGGAAGAGGLAEITNPGQYIPGPGNGVPLDPNATLQPWPSDIPVSLPGAPSIPGVGPGLQTPGSIVDQIASDANQQAGSSMPSWLRDLLGSSSSAPAWLSALIPALNSIGQYEAANKASDAQAAAYQNAIDEQKRQFDLSRSDYAPYLKTGTDALGRLNALSNGDMTPFQTSPDYTFRRDQGLQGIENQFSASGGALSGNALKALNEFNSNLASGEYGNYWNRQAGLAGVGQTATGQIGQLGAQTAGNVGNALIGQGDARGTGVAGQWSAIGNLGNNLYKNFYPTPSYNFYGYRP